MVTFLSQQLMETVDQKINSDIEDLNYTNKVKPGDFCMLKK